MKRNLFFIFSVAYVIIALWLLFFFPFFHSSRLNYDVVRSVSLVPFHTTSNYVQQAWHFQDTRHTVELLANIGGNFMLFVPFGIILATTALAWPVALCIGGLSSLAVETIQITTSVGSFDVDDVIWNTVGTVVGFLLWKKFSS